MASVLREGLLSQFQGSLHLQQSLVALLSSSSDVKIAVPCTRLSQAAAASASKVVVSVRGGAEAQTCYWMAAATGRAVSGGRGRSECCVVGRGLAAHAGHGDSCMRRGLG